MKTSKKKIKTGNVKTRIEHDSMGEVLVPADAMYGASTQRAIDNFPISSTTLQPNFIEALGLIKLASAIVNKELKLIEPNYAKAIIKAATEIANGNYYEQFPIDIFQTGSGTSTNMNANEVIAHLATYESKLKVHPNDHVNMCQSSNDVIPTAIHVSSSLSVHNKLIPALEHLIATLEKRIKTLAKVTKTGRTHLMDAMPVTMAQEFSGWSQQLKNNLNRIKQCQPDIQQLAIGGTAVGTGINAHRDFGKKVCKTLTELTHIKFSIRENYFEALSSQDAIVELSGSLKTLAVSLMKIANDLRLMNSGPLAGLGEIILPAIQPGSSIMPGKVNPVIPESICMIAAKVIGNDTTITLAGQSGNFQLNVMLPLIAYNILQSIEILANGMNHLADKAINSLTINEANIKANLLKNPILVTALNSVIGYEKGAEIAKKAYKEGKPIIEVASIMTNIPRKELERLLDPYELTKGGITK